MYMHIGPIVNVGLAAVLVSLSCSLCTTFRSFMHVLFNLSPECLILGNLHCGINTSHFLYVACGPPRRGLVAWGSLDVLWHYHKKKSPLT